MEGSASGDNSSAESAARCLKPPLKREGARTEQQVGQSATCVQPRLHNANVSSGSESASDTQPVDSQPDTSHDDSQRNSHPSKEHRQQQQQQPSLNQRSSVAKSESDGTADDKQHDTDASESEAKRPKTKGYGYGYGKGAQSDAGAAQGLVGYTYDMESGWYFNNTDPTWLYSAEQQVHFHTASQQFYVTGKDGALVPYTTPAETAHVPAVFRCDKLNVSGSMRCMQGRRPTQEDRHTVLDKLEGAPVRPCAFYGVYDGHCGVDASTYCEEHLHQYIASQLQALSAFDEEAIKAAITQAVEELDKGFLQLAQLRKRMDGSCVLAACVLGSKLFVTHLGDSRAVLCRDNKAVRLTEDHKPDVERERQRIEAAGGRVLKVGTVYRATHSTKEENAPHVMLAVARSIGDLKLKTPQVIVSATPDTNCYDLEPDRDAFVVLGCDGVWDVLSDNDVVTLILDRHHAAVERAGSADPGVLQHRDFTAADAASLVVKTAFERGSNDNISVIVVDLKWTHDSAAEVGERPNSEDNKAVGGERGAKQNKEPSNNPQVPSQTSKL